MSKTLHRTFDTAVKHAVIRKTDKILKMENAMMKSINEIWHEAQKDLLQPRPQALSELLRKIHE